MVIVLKNLICVVLSFLIIIFSLMFCKIQQSTSANIYSSKMPLIIIDAGHGGEDGGAVASDGTLEKDINLDISLKLNDMLSIMGIETKLIRKIDKAIHTKGDTIRERKVSDIRNRFHIMNTSGNCLYISIHQNKFGDESIYGAQTFYSPNNVESKELAEFIQKSISSQLQINNNRLIKKSGTDIFLLYNATKPAIMVECGFISNAKELHCLKDTDYQCKMALSIAMGIMNYNISEGKNGSEI